MLVPANRGRLLGTFKPFSLTCLTCNTGPFAGIFCAVLELFRFLSLDNTSPGGATIPHWEKFMIDNNENTTQQQNDDSHARREFLKKIGKGSATIPAAVLLLAATSKSQAFTLPSGSCTIE